VCVCVCEGVGGGMSCDSGGFSGVMDRRFEVDLFSVPGR
jgi:hypothetical protein